MASTYKRKLKNGKNSWRVVVRLRGYPAVCETFDRKPEAEDWAADVERRIKQGKFKFDQHNQQHTFGELVDRYIRDGALEHHRSAKDTLRHLEYWKDQLSAYGLVHLTADLIGRKRQLLVETPSPDGKKRSPATINRYMASLSAIFSYATRQLRWVEENPCLTLKKLKESSGRDCVLTDEEIGRLINSCLQSRSPYLYCIVLIAITTGARQGEILNFHYDGIQLYFRMKRHIMPGGGIWYSFSCHCGRGVQKLYLRNRKFACRNCHGLAYRSENKSKTDRPIDQKWKYLRKLGCDSNIPQRPKWMKRYTFNKFRQRIEKYDEIAYDRFFGHWFNGRSRSS